MKNLILLIIVGWASQYAPGKMQEVIRVRQSGRTAYTVPQDLSYYDGFIAMESCSELGNVYNLRPLGKEEWELFLVVDCSGHKSTSQWMLRNNILVEVDYETAKRWNAIGRGIQIEMIKGEKTYERSGTSSNILGAVSGIDLGHRRSD